MRDLYRLRRRLPQVTITVKREPSGWITFAHKLGLRHRTFDDALRDAKFTARLYRQRFVLIVEEEAA